MLTLCARRWFTYLSENKTVPRPYSASAATFCLARCKKLLQTAEDLLQATLKREADAASAAAKSKQETLALLEKEAIIRQEYARCGWLCGVVCACVRGYM